MTITSELKLVSKIKVGTSAEYAVKTIRTATSITTPANQTRASYEEIRWDLECLAEIDAPTSIAALNETIKSELVKIGLAVTLTELGSDRTLPAQGVGGSLVGYPRVELVDIPEKSIAQYQAFTLTATTRIPSVDGSGIVEHTTETQTVTNADGTIETSVSGEVRLADNVDASSWVNTNVFSPVRAAADAAGNALVTRVSTTDDTSHAKYSYAVKPGVAGSPGVTEASVEDRTVKELTGRRVRTISGFAKGTSATTFAAAQRVAESANLKLLREDGPSLPSVPDGRVSFTYQYAAGVAHVDYPGIFITRHNERVEKLGGGRQIDAASYFTGLPSLRLGESIPFVYKQTSEIEFIGGNFADHALTPLLDVANLSGSPRERRSGDGQLKTVSMDWTFIFAQELDPMPTPRTINGLA